MATQEKDYTQQFEATLQALHGDDYADQARRYIDPWLEALRASDDLMLKTLTSELNSLKKLLSTPQPDKQALSSLLRDIGEHTLEIAVATRGEVGNMLGKMGDALKLAGSKIH